MNFPSHHQLQSLLLLIRILLVVEIAFCINISNSIDKKEVICAQDSSFEAINLLLLITGKAKHRRAPSCI